MQAARAACVAKLIRGGTPTKMASPLEIALLALLGLLWGMPYALTKIALATIPPVTLVAARVALAAAVLWIIVLFMGCKIPSRRDFVGGLFVQGCVGCAIPYGLIAIAQQSVDSALAAILNSPTPIFVFLISLAWTRHEPLTAGRIFGVTMGLGGVVLIAGASALLGLGEAAAGQTAIIVATISSAVGAIYSRRFDAVAPQVTAAGALTCAALVLGPLCVFVEAPLQSTPSAAAIAALLVNAVLATALGFVVYFRLVRTIGSMGAASVSYLKPAAGVLIGCTLLGETLTWTQGLGLVAILTGVTAINPKGLHGWLRPGQLQPTSTGVAEKSAQKATQV
jgi:drug/metabolite transporter (DMT)-like permease